MRIFLKINIKSTTNSTEIRSTSQLGPTFPKEGFLGTNFVKCKRILYIKWKLRNPFPPTLRPFTCIKLYNIIYSSSHTQSVDAECGAQSAAGVLEESPDLILCNMYVQIYVYL